MEINEVIIENVKKYPQLYQNFDLTAREKSWKLLAKSLKLNEQFLKSRWHILRERYAKELQNAMDGSQTRSRFKYAKAMSFLRRHIKIRETANSSGQQEHIPSNWIKPEFVITAADLELQVENEKNHEDIMFMEIEEENEIDSKEIEDHHDEVHEDVCVEVEDSCHEIVEDESNEQEVKDSACQEIVDDSHVVEVTSQESDCNDVANINSIETEIEAKSIKEHNSQDKEEVHQDNVDLQDKIPMKQTKDENKETREQDFPQIYEIKTEVKTTVENNTKNVVEQKETEKRVIVEKIGVPLETIPKPEEISVEKERISSADSNIKTDANNIQKSESPVKNTRCEDAIFGELIVAMLKSMDPVKKKAIKKEIMNLLLS